VVFGVWGGVSLWLIFLGLLWRQPLLVAAGGGSAACVLFLVFRLPRR
jgi:hypothetical protein